MIPVSPETVTASGPEDRTMKPGNRRIRMSSLLIRNIRALVSCDANDTVYEQVNLYCENGLVSGIGPEA